MTELEVEQIDTRFSTTRIRDLAVENRLLSSIARQGVCDPVHVARLDTGYVLLDGFKRYRCVRRLKYPLIPAVVIAPDPAWGILTLMRQAYSRGLPTIEQACLIDVLHQQYGLGVREIAGKLGRSASWVSLRLGMMQSMSAVVREKILGGEFPIRAYMYWMRKFTRVTPRDVDAFVTAVGSFGLSTRNALVLGKAFFQGTPLMRKQILGGNIEWTLRSLKQDTMPDDAGRDETGHRRLLYDLNRCRECMGRTMSVAHDITLPDNTECTIRLHMLCGAILAGSRRFITVVRELYDRSGQTAGGADPVPSGQKQAQHSATSAHR